MLAALLLPLPLLLAPSVAAHPGLMGAGPVPATGTVRAGQLIVSGYDFSEYPPADLPPPINATWNAMYDIASINLPNIPVKNPPNSIEEPPCPLTKVTCDWGCFNCTKTVDALACPDHNTWALSYDDGPSVYTLPLLEALNKIGAKATFCIVGSRALAHPEILRQVYDAGHQICAHTWSHRFLTTQTNEQIVAEFEWAIRIIQQITGARPAYARPPFGDIDDRVRAVFAKMNLIPLLWNRDTFDWNLGNPNSGYQVQWVTGNFSQWIATAGSTSTGFMSLEHDLYQQSGGQALPALDIVAKAGYKLQSWSQCANTNPYLSVVSVPIPQVAPVTGGGTVSTGALPTARSRGNEGNAATAVGLPKSAALTAACAAALSLMAVSFLSA
ncbi:chitin deacetylase [Polyrhizophydium stewartii]|uniref:Chitin deacetylase n=1 Tax=Polyrhizophydium stewartii TaxID=2732419 RepID=A0ABR4NBI2_9FUNG